MRETVSVVFTMCRSTLGYFGFGQGNCLYYPTCTEVIKDSLIEKGFLKTLYLIPQRIFICNFVYKKFGKKWQ
mgnify:CR=1 FL=1